MGNNNFSLYIALRRVGRKAKALPYILFSLYFLISMVAAQSKPDTLKKDTTLTKPQEKKEYELGEEVITGAATFKITDSKIYFPPMIDPLGPVNELLKSDEYIFDEKLASEINSKTIPLQILRSSFLRVPLRREFFYGDVLLFIPKFEKSVASWELVISNSLGETVRRITRKGNPPPIISWDGRTDSKDMVITGEIYTFTFNAYDALGNQTRIPGKPQKISGIVYEEKGETIITIAGDEIFQRGSEQFTLQAESRIVEATNVIKERFKSRKSGGKEIVIYVYSENEELSLKRCNILSNEFSKRMVLPSERLKVAPRFIPGLQPKFSKVEIRIH